LCARAIFPIAYSIERPFSISLSAAAAISLIQLAFHQLLRFQLIHQRNQPAGLRAECRGQRLLADGGPGCKNPQNPCVRRR